MALPKPHIITPDSALGGTQIQRSLRFNSADNEYLIRTCSSEGNRVKWTWSGWVKKTRNGRTTYALLSSDNGGDGGGNNGIASIYFHSSDAIHTYYDTDSGNNYGAINDTVYRDPNSWYHIVWQVDAANGTSKIWVNGVEQSINSGAQPVSGYNYTMNQSGKHMTIGTDAWDIYTFSDTYIAETHYSDGQLYAASDFGYTDAQTGQWRPKNGNVIKSNITYGTNGFWLDFRDATSTTTLGYDYSGNGNHWTLTNMSVTNNYNVAFTSDTPTNNFCTMNNVDNDNITCTNGGLELTQANTGVGCRIRGTQAMPPNTGKYYYEMEIQTGSSYVFGIKGVERLGSHTSGNEGRYGYYGHNGNKSDESGSSSYGATYTAGDTVAILYDSDSGEVYFYKNNTSQGLAFTGVNDKTYLPFVYLDNYGTNPVVHVNFGQRPFKYTPPTGAQKLSSKNLATANAAGIVKPQRHFGVLSWTGNDSSQTIDGLEFTPDFVWIKGRRSGEHHFLTDVIRGAGLRLQTSSSNVESDRSSEVTSFVRGGFTIAGTHNEINGGGVNIIGMCWKAGGAAVSNSDGSITSQVSANQEAGFSIVTFSITSNAVYTVGHGLGKAPQWIMMKARNTTNNWDCYHVSVGNTKRIKMNDEVVPEDYTEPWNDTTPTSSVFTSTGSWLGGNGTNCVAYCWTEIPGYSKFGEYVGNGSSDGPYVHLGFKPAFIIYKKVAGGSDNWEMQNTTIDTVNPVNESMYPNTSGAQSTGRNVDFLSNGFKIRNANGNTNEGRSYTYIYMAWAERPSGTIFGLDANAR